MRYSDRTCAAKTDFEAVVLGEKKKTTLGANTKRCRSLSVEILSVHSNSHLNTRKCHCTDYMKECLQRFKSLSVLDSHEYEHLSVHIARNVSKKYDNGEETDEVYRRRL